jgi:hypothetical protein
MPGMNRRVVFLTFTSSLALPARAFAAINDENRTEVCGATQKGLFALYSEQRDKRHNLQDKRRAPGRPWTKERENGRIKN